jgi:hypothetical protein
LPECAQQVSSLAAACPKCAAPIAQRDSARAVGQQKPIGRLSPLGYIVLIVPILVVMALGSMQQSVDDDGGPKKASTMAANAEYRTDTFGKFTESDLCRAAIATLNGYQPRVIFFRSSSRVETTVHYRRSGDSTDFQYVCKIEGVEIRWRDATMSDWNSSTRITFGISADGSELTIRLVDEGEERNAERLTFRKDDFR